jgi:hypothetical protein
MRRIPRAIIRKLRICDAVVTKTILRGQMTPRVRAAFWEQGVYGLDAQWEGREPMTTGQVTRDSQRAESRGPQIGPGYHLDEIALGFSVKTGMSCVTG